MILTKNIHLKITNHSQVKALNKLGVKVKLGEEIDLPVERLSKGSHQIVRVKCVNCGLEKEIQYNTYYRTSKGGKYGYYCGKEECRKVKRNLSNQEKYGVNNVFELETIKTKIKDTNLELYGVENPQQNKDIKIKTQNTCLAKYGVTNPAKNPQIIQKIKEKFLREYGVETPLLLPSTRDKIKQNNLNRYGVEFLYESEIFRQKSAHTIKDKYGVDNITQTKLYQEKIIENFIYNYKPLDIRDVREKEIDIFCSKCNQIFTIFKHTFYHRLKKESELCTYCFPVQGSSIPQEKLLSFLQEIYKGEIIVNNRQIISPYELDIYLPQEKLAFEFNGLYWHNELNKDKHYHLNKTELCEAQNIQLIHIYEDDWDFRKKILESMIKNRLGLTQKRIYGRQCEIREIKDNNVVKVFLSHNHLQGYNTSSLKLGLFHQEQLVSLMTFGKKRRTMNSKSKAKEWEMYRFCNQLDTNVIGGASKLFKYFIKCYQPQEVVSYANRSYSQGKLYQNLGFPLISKTPPNYFYVVGRKREYRFKYRKDILVKEGYDPHKSEHEIMLERGLYRIYDSGSLKFRYSMK
jgi:hypothetical protein